MEPIACLISVCKYEFPTILIDVGNGVEYFDEYMWQQYRVSW